MKKTNDFTFLRALLVSLVWISFWSGSPFQMCPLWGGKRFESADGDALKSPFCQS